MSNEQNEQVAPLVRMTTKEYSHSQVEVRDVPLAHAKRMGLHGGFNRVTIEEVGTGILIDEFKCVEIDY
jgi:hypothetical protein